MISPLQNLQTLLTIEHQLLANLVQNIGGGAEQMQQTAGQAGTAENAANLPQDNSPQPPLKLRGGEDKADSIAQTIKETGEFLATTQKEQTPPLKEQIVSLTQTLVQQGHLPSSTLNQPIPVIIPQMLACLGKLHREEKKKAKKKKKKEDDESEEKRDTPVDALLKQIFRLDGSGLTSRG